MKTLALIMGMALCVPAYADTSAPVAPENTIIDTDEDDANRMTVPVMINGLGPFQFVIDTGADRTVVSAELAAKLDLPKGKKVTLHAMGGQAEVRIVHIDSVQISTNLTRNVRAAALPRKYLGADGLLGIDSLKGQRVVMDFESQTMKVVPSNEPEQKIESDEQLIIVTARTRLGQLVMVDADANGEKIWVVVDTGAQNSVGNSRLRKLLVERGRSVKVQPIEMLDVLGKRTAADYTLVNRLRIGGFAMGNAAVAFAEVHPFKLFGLTQKPSMLLGMESLRVFKRVSVDFTSRKVKFLLPNESSLPGDGDALAANAAGLELASAP